MGQCRRYGVIDTRECLRVLDGATLEEFRANYQAMIGARLTKDVLSREPQWTESVAVGSRAFVKAIGQTISHRQHLTYAALDENAWVLREDPLPLFRETA